MRKTGFVIFAVILVFMLGGCTESLSPIFSSADKRVQAQEKLSEIKELIKKEEFDKAFEESKSIVNSKYLTEDELNAIVVMFQNEDRFEEGLYLLNVLLLRDKNNDSTLNNLSWAYHMINKNESANLFADRALAISSNSKYQFSNKANALRGLGKYEEAIEYYDKALAMAPDFSEAVWGKAMTYDDLEDYARALEFFIKYRELKPDDEKSTRYYITSCYRQLGQLNNAIEEYESFYEQDKNDTSPLYSIAYIYYQEEEHDKALEYFDKILGVEPDDAWAYYGMVDCYAKTDRMDEAISAMKKATEIDPYVLYEMYYLDEADKIMSHKDFVTLFQ
jgi:tetratricopeptide (TPR) repeat protein